MSWYNLHEDVKKYEKLGIAPSSSLMLRLKRMAVKRAALDKELSDLRGRAEEVLTELEKQAETKMLENFKRDVGLEFGKPYVATPKFSGRPLNIIPSNVKLNYSGVPMLVCSVFNRSGVLSEVKEINPTAWEFTPAEELKKALQRGKD